MKIYWRNLIWNYTGRYLRLYRYYKSGLNKSKWKTFYYPHKIFWNSKQEAKLHRKLDKTIKNTEFNLF